MLDAMSLDIQVPTAHVISSRLYQFENFCLQFRTFTIVLSFSKVTRELFFGNQLFELTEYGIYHHFSTKFGLFDCDYSDSDLPLTPKASAEYMREVTSTHCIPDSLLIG